MPERPDVLVRQAPPVPHGRRASPLQRRRPRAHRRVARRAAVPAGVLRPALSGVEPAPAGTRLRRGRSTRPTGRRRAASRGARCCARAPSRTRPTASGVNRVGDDGAGIAHAGDSVVLDFTGQPLLELDDMPQVITVPLDLRGPARLARQVSRASRCGCLYSGIMKKPTLVNHPPDVSPPPGNLPVIAPIYQSVKYEFENGGRHAAHAARRDARLFLHARQQPHHAPARADAGAAAGPRRLPGHRLGRQRHRADADRRSRSRATTSCASSRPTAPRATSSGGCWRGSASSTPCCPSRTWPASKTCSPRGRRAW